MNINEFHAGVWIKQSGYRSFNPERINHEWIIPDPEIQSLTARASRLVGELNAFSQYVPDVNFFISMHVIKEATVSSRIEGTRTNIEEALFQEEDIDPEKREDWNEVQNYIKAMDEAITQLETLPISTRLIQQAHHTLLQGVRGIHKLPGEYRTSQNWIGGKTLDDAEFVPPHPAEISDLMRDLENFIHNDDIYLPELIKIAITHYQFETIHPFLDGNGRLGRLLITLYLVSKGLLARPVLYLSDFFEKNRQLYYDNLNKVRFTNNMAQWLKFFLVGVTETATIGIETFKNIVVLKERVEEEILTLGIKSRNAKQLLLSLYKNPIITAKKAANELDVSIPTANTLIDDLVNLNILNENTGFKRNRIFIFSEYLSLFVNT